MNISELNYLENVNEVSLVNGGSVSVSTSAGASASGFLPSAYTESFVSASTSDSYDWWYGYYTYESGYADSSAGASAFSGSVSAGTSASGSAS